MLLAVKESDRGFDFRPRFRCITTNRRCVRGSRGWEINGLPHPRGSDQARFTTWRYSRLPSTTYSELRLMKAKLSFSSLSMLKQICVRTSGHLLHTSVLSKFICYYSLRVFAWLYASSS